MVHPSEWRSAPHRRFYIYGSFVPFHWLGSGWQIVSLFGCCVGLGVWLVVG